MAVLQALQKEGWFLSDEGLEQCCEGLQSRDLRNIIKVALDTDLRDICIAALPDDANRAKNESISGPMVLQIQKLRNTGAPKANEESNAAPRMFKMVLTDGRSTINAVEEGSMARISINTPPGTKIRLKGTINFQNNFLLLNNSCAEILGGHVPSLVERWEINRSLAKHNRGIAVEGGPPPWIPFGQRRVHSNPQDKNFKSLGQADKENAKENAEFEAQRKDAIAEASAKGGVKKVFRGGNKQMLDRNVQQIVDAGFSAEQAQLVLAKCNNEVERALRTLQRQEDRRNRSERTGNGGEERNGQSERGRRKGGRGEEGGDEGNLHPSKPSGAICLFDFLQDKLPSVPNDEKTSSYNFDYERNTERKTHRDVQSSRYNNSGGGNKGGGNSSQRGSYNSNRGRDYYKPGGGNSGNRSGNRSGGRDDRMQESQKPPRFQNQQSNRWGSGSNSGGSSNAGSYRYERNNTTSGSFVQGTWSNQDANVIMRQDDVWSCSNNNWQQEDSSPFSDTSSYSQFPSGQNRFSGGLSTVSQQHNTVPTAMQGSLPSSQQPVFGNYSWPNSDAFASVQATRQTSQQQQATQHTLQPQLNLANGFTNQWKVGAKCLARYWEDNKFYPAEVTALTDETCMVHFVDYGNCEEVYRHDCIPMPESFSYTNAPNSMSSTGGTFFNEGQFSGSLEFRRGGDRPYFKSAIGQDSSNGSQNITNGSLRGGAGRERDLEPSQWLPSQPCYISPQHK